MDPTKYEESECIPILGKSNSCMSKNAENEILKKVGVKNIDDAIDKVKCGTEKCVVKEVLGEHHVELNRYKRNGPANNDDLLSNHDIDGKLKELAQKYKDFYPIKFQMIDFEKQQTELANIDFVDLREKGYKRFAVVLNTDTSDGPGEHWFVLYIDFTNPNLCVIEYFNSSGRVLYSEVEKWVAKIRNKIFKESDSHCEYIHTSKIVHQKSKTECGVYSLYYIWSRLEGVKWQYFRDNRIPDGDMYKFRKSLFHEE